MKRERRFRYLIGGTSGLACLLLVCAAARLFGLSFVVPTKALKEHPFDYRAGSVVNPILDVLPNVEKTVAYLVISSDDRDQWRKHFGKSVVRKTSNPETLQVMREKLSFTITDSDLATVTSRLMIVHNGDLVLDVGIVMDDDRAGLQSREFGWAESLEATELIEAFKKFDPVWCPVVWP